MKISIIIPVYNTKTYIDICLTSLLKQKSHSLEFIIIDDGSTDGSGEICDKYAQKDKRFHVYHQFNQGVSATRNIGLKYSHGEYIAWVDSDDYISQNWSNTVIRYIKRYNPDCLLYDYSILYSDGIKIMNFKNKSQVLAKRDYIYELSCEHKLHSYLWIHIIKRDIWDQYFFPKGVQVMEDYQALTKLSDYMNNIYYVHKPLYFYRQHGNNSTRSSDLSIWSYCLKIAQERHDYFSHCGYKVSQTGVLKIVLTYIYQYHKSKMLLYIDKNGSNYVNEYKKCHRKIRRNIFYIIEKSDFSIIEKVKAIFEVMYLGSILFKFIQYCPEKIRCFIKKR